MFIINNKITPNTLNQLALFCIFTLYSSLTVAIVNMDGLHFDNNQDAFTAALDLSVSGSSGNSDTKKAALNAQLNWISEKSINLAIVGYQRGESNTVRNVNKAFVHYRYIHQINKTFAWELFGQLETNEFTRLSYRSLLGTGGRYLLAKSEQHRAFFGFGGFHVKEETEFTAGLTDDGVEEYARANFYLLSKYKVKPTISFSNAIYYQPRLNDFSDYRALLESKFDFKINEDLSFRLSLDIEHDSEPSQSIKETDISYMTGFIYNF